MVSNNREERERMKEEYKEHYRKIREARERLMKTQHTRNISEALKNMDAAPLMESFDLFLNNVKNKLAHVEARLDVAMDNLLDDEDVLQKEREMDEELRKEKARDTLRQAKAEMGLLYKEVEQQAEAIEIEKTIGREKKTSDTSD